MEQAVTSVSQIGLTILGIAVGWLIIVWLDRNVFNKGRYYHRKKNEEK